MVLLRYIRKERACVYKKKAVILSSELEINIIP